MIKAVLSSGVTLQLHLPFCTCDQCDVDYREEVDAPQPTSTPVNKVDQPQMHSDGCRCDWCTADRNSRIDAMQRLKARGEFAQAGQEIVYHDEPCWYAPDGIYIDRISQQDTMLINLFAISAEVKRPH